MLETIDLADKAAQTAHELTMAIRIAVRTDQGSSELVRLRDVVKDVEALLHHKLRYLEFSAQCPDNLAIRGKRSEMIQLLMNLLSNAADALGEVESKKLSVHVLAKNGRIHLMVEDSGPGVPEKIRSLIFEPFYTTKPTGKGTGLGLAVVKAVTKRAGGELELDASPELGGARFTVILPAA
jgi:C4-dicarboxylate-specific signal transduction histidine kinase